MNNSNQKENLDADILKCKEDILRARDIIPPYSEKPRRELRPQETDENRTSSGNATEASAKTEETVKQNLQAPKLDKAEQGTDTSSIPVETIDSKVADPPTLAVVNSKEKGTKEQGKIPKFDLAEEIMAEHRKITANRRAAPGSKAEVRDKKLEGGLRTRTLVQPTSALSGKKQVIAEIVARDIEKLCRGGTLSIGTKILGI